MRLIDADALKEYIGSVRAEFDFFDDDERARYEAHSKAIYLLNLYVDDAPSIDIEPKRGEWIRHENSRYSYDREQGDMNAGVYYTCSECDYISSTHNFCPNCGVNMQRGEDK